MKEFMQRLFCHAQIHRFRGLQYLEKTRLAVFQSRFLTQRLAQDPFQAVSPRCLRHNPFRNRDKKGLPGRGFIWGFCFGNRQRKPPFHDENGLNRQPFSSFAAAALNHVATVAGTHFFTKAVRAKAFDIGLSGQILFHKARIIPPLLLNYKKILFTMKNKQEK